MRAPEGTHYKKVIRSREPRTTLLHVVRTFRCAIAVHFLSNDNLSVFMMLCNRLIERGLYACRNRTEVSRERG